MKICDCIRDETLLPKGYLIEDASDKIAVK